jgi:hypothetical protein
MQRAGAKNQPASTTLMGEYEMRISGIINQRRFAIAVAALFAIVLLTLIAQARPSTSLNIVNNSSRAIRNVYLSHVDTDDWSGNQLGDATIASGQSFTLPSVACDQQQVKVIAEDQDGCFITTVVDCGSNATWTITNDTARDCGN